MKTWLLTFLLLLPCLALHAADEYPILVYPCPKAEQAPEIDGHLDDKVWDAAPLVSGFTFYNAQKLVDVQTGFRVLYDQERLYFAIRCEEPLAGKIARSVSSKDSHAAVFGAESVEVFLDPGHDHSHYFQFAGSLGGTLYDAEGHESSWDSRTQVVTVLQQDSWTVEMAIRWSDLKARDVTPGKIIGFNVCRNRYIEGRQWTNWSQTEANFHDPERFAHLVLSPTPQQIAPLAGDFRKGERNGPLQIFAKEGMSQDAYVALARWSLKKVEALLADLDKAAKAEGEATTAEMGKRMVGLRLEVGELRKRLESVASIDALEWVKIDLRLNQITNILNRLTWEARLAALLQSI